MRIIRVTAALGAALCALAGPAFAGVPRGGERFVVEQNRYLVGQAPDWLDAENVVFHDPFLRDDGADGQIHIHRSTLDGKRRRCLTCGLEGPHQVPVVQPDGDWILFHSWSGHDIRLGGAGFGGIGSDVWVMTRDGKRRTNLTNSPELNDNFHAYWSPDGRHIVWTSLNWNAAEGGNGRSDVRVARFESDGPAGPRLVGEHVVRRGNGHWYETQWWAPDGSGFLYTETAGTAINPELFFCRLPDPDRGRCRPSRLTRNLAWDEQAIFTPDMKRVIFMSSRNLRGGHDNWIRVADFLDLPARFDYLLILSVFSDSFLQPRLSQATDLYEQDLRWEPGRAAVRPRGAPRRLTRTGERGWITPEFAWDPSGRRLLWTENRFPADVRVDQSCVMRELREKFIRRLSEVDGIAEIPFDIDREIREETTEPAPGSEGLRGTRGLRWDDGGSRRSVQVPPAHADRPLRGGPVRHRARGLLTAPPCRSPEGRNPGCDGDPRSSEPIRLAADFTALLLAHPNVVAYVAGHHHTNRVTAYRRPDGQGGPIAAPPAGTPGARFARSQLAAIGRTFSFNDPQSETNGGPGTPTDRNVELLLADPRR